jgi:hypothetical protein
MYIQQLLTRGLLLRPLAPFILEPIVLSFTKCLYYRAPYRVGSLHNGPLHASLIIIPPLRELPLILSFSNCL